MVFNVEYPNNLTHEFTHVLCETEQLRDKHAQVLSDSFAGDPP